MANENFVVEEGLSVGQTTIDAATGQVTATGNIVVGSTTIAVSSGDVNVTAGNVNVGGTKISAASGNIVAGTTTIIGSTGEIITSANIRTTASLVVGTTVISEGGPASFDNVLVTGGTINNTSVGATTPATGKFTSMTTSNVVVTGGTMSGVTITNSPLSGSTVSATSVTTNNAQITGGSITNTPVSGSTVGATTLTTANAQVTGGAIDSTPIGTTNRAAGKFTTLDADSGILGTLQTASQPNITAVGPLASLAVNTSVTAASFSGNFSGSGASLNSIPNGALVNSDVTFGNTTVALGGSSSFLTGMTAITATTFNGNFTGSGANLTNIPNGALNNSSVAFGNTTVALGGSSATLVGLTSVSATDFTGALTGTVGATTASTGAFTTLEANAGITGTLQTNAQPNITSVGNLTTLQVNGSVNGGAASFTSIGATSTFTVSADILPLTTNVSNIGSASQRFNTIFVNTAKLSTNTLYLGETAILGTSASTVNIHTDPNQSLSLQTTGASGNMNFASNAQISMQTTGNNSDVVIQSNGTGSKTRLLSTNELDLTAPTIVAAGNVTVNNNLLVSGNLTVTGTTTAVNSTDLNITDNVIIVNSGETGVGVTAGTAGIQFARGQVSSYQLVFQESDDSLQFGAIGSLNPVVVKSGGTIVSNLTGNVTGNADTATTLATARSISLSGAATGSASFNGASNATITVAISNATQATAGFLSAGDKTKLDTLQANAAVTSVAGRQGVVTLTASDVAGLANVATSGDYLDLSNRYVLPVATTLVLGGVKQGANVIIDANGVISATGSVTSVAGKTGAVTLTASDVSGYATVATSGSYNDLSNTPVIPAAQVNTDWNSTTGVNQLLNKPTLANVATSGSYTDLSNKPASYVLPVATTLILGGVKQGANVSIDANGFISASGSVSSVAGKTGAVTLAAADVSGLSTVATSGSYTDLSNLPTIPSAYILPVATAAVLGGVKQGTNTTIDVNGAISVASFPVTAVFNRTGNIVLQGSDVSTALGYTPLNPNVVGALNGVASLDNNGKLTTGQIPTSLVGALQYQGVWDASANSPTLVSSTGTKGHYYKVSVAGNSTLDGYGNWSVGDLVIFDGFGWEQVQGGSSDVVSVFGRVGAVTLTSSDVTTALGANTVVNSTNAVNSTNSVNVGITDDTASATTHYPTLAGVTTGNEALAVSSTKLSFVPSTGALSVAGTVAHAGLVMTAASAGAIAVDEKYTFTMSSTALGTSWADTGIVGTSQLVNGVYMLYLQAGANEFYTATLPWSSENGAASLLSDFSEVPLVKTGDGGTASNIYLRIMRFTSAAPKLQISASGSLSAYAYVFNFRRIW